MSALEPRRKRQTRSRKELRSRLRNYWRDAQWWVIGVLGLTAGILGFIGLHDYRTDVGGSTDFWDLLYDDIRLFIFAGALAEPDAINPPLQIARFLAPAVASVALLRAFAPRLRDQVQLLRFRLTRGHVVVCGLGRRGLRLATALRESGHRVVAVELTEANDHIATSRSAGVPVLVGDATDITTLVKAGADHASHVMAVCSDEGVNAEIAVAAHQLIDNRSKPLNCVVHVTDPHLCSLLRARYMTAPDAAQFRLDFFNTYERGAQALLLRHPPFPDSLGELEERPPHMLVVGLGRLGTSLVVQAARNWEAADTPEPHRTLRITAVDERADDHVGALLHQHPEISEQCVIVPITVDVHSPDFERCVVEADGGMPITAAYICFDNDAQSMETAFVLHNRLRGRGVPIVMRAVTESGLPALLGPRLAAEFADLHTFALLDRTCDPDFILGGIDEVIARALHDVYVRRRVDEGWQYGPTHDEDTKTTPSIAPWRHLHESFRESNRDQAANTAVKLRAVGCELDELTEWHHEPFTFTSEEVELLAEMEHERFNIDRSRHGWKLGPKDHEQKRSPYIVPWADLPNDVREYDREFVRSLPGILAKLGYRIVRTQPGPSASLG